MERFALSAESRNAVGKGPARRMRAEGRIPGILYGLAKETVSLSLDRREISMLLRRHEGLHMLLDLTVSGDSGEATLAMLHRTDVDPVNRTLLHADFLRVDPNKPIHTTVPLHVTGMAQGVREGGVHQHVLREVEVEALPAEIPEFIEINIAHLHIGDSIHISDVDVEGKPYKIVTEAERVISTILAPKLTLEATEEGAAGEGVAEGAAEGEAEAAEEKSEN